tara:strand:- start:359 stop:724 length:366 start_codon:yes stop_codon:yes gene_type:complete
MANQSEVIVNRFGNNGLFTKSSDKIDNLYNKNNEPLFSTLEMMTIDGEKITIKGDQVIDNANMFKRAPIPSYLKWILPILKIGSTFSSIDPYYTRFSSGLNISIKDSIYEGNGVLEIMDLK